MKAMRKQEFIDRLRENLSGLPTAETEERLDFYEEMIEDRMEEGISEEEAVAAIGSPDKIAAQIIEEIPLKKIVKEKIKPKRKLKAWEIVLLAVGSPIWVSLLIIVPFAVGISLYASLWSVIGSLWAVFVSVAASAFGGTVGGIGLIFLSHVPSGLVLISAGLFCAGLSVFLFCGCKAVTKGAVWLTKKIAFGIKNLFIRKEKAQ
jgi:uncharacterized membrane protein